MYKQLRTLAIVPARGGSKGIAFKNLKEVGEGSLVGWAGKVIAQLPWIDRAVVSTDSEEIAAEAEAHGIEAPFRRPESLSGDRIGDWDVLSHALAEMESRDGCRYDVILMLQPTCPFRKARHVEDAVSLLVEGKFDAVWSVSETDSKAHPRKQLLIDDASGEMDYYDPSGAEVIARQQLAPLFHRNGAVYAITRQCLLEQGSIKGGRCGALLIEDPLVNIDTPLDLEWANFVASREKPVV
ncbi:MAG: cytidylyltransferase domain-containing protein [Verrucomicrobiales bacterium]